MFGNYDQCLKLRVFHDDEDGSDVSGLTAELPEAPEEPKEFFRGQYCVAEFKPWLPKKPRFYGMNTVLKSPFQDTDSVSKLKHSFQLRLLNVFTSHRLSMNSPKWQFSFTFCHSVSICAYLQPALKMTFNEWPI